MAGNEKLQLMVALMAATLLHLAVLGALEPPTRQLRRDRDPPVLLRIEELGLSPAAPARTTKDKRPEFAASARRRTEAPSRPLEAAAKPAASGSLKREKKERETAKISSLSTSGEQGTGREIAEMALQESERVRASYRQALAAWLERHKFYPLAARRLGLEGKGSLLIRINRSGKVQSRAIASPTSSTLLDAAALDMVARSDPFPAMPADLGGDHLEFVVPVEFRLH